MKDKITTHKGIILDVAVTLLFLGIVVILVLIRTQTRSNLTQAFQERRESRNATITTNTSDDKNILGESVSNPELLYKMLNGWNFISFPVKAVSFSTASELIEYIAKNGGYATTIARWDGDRWQEYSFRVGKEYGLDFPIIPLQAYFIRNHQTFTLRVVGEPLRENEIEKITLKPGWNAIGMLGKEEMLGDKLDQINQEDVEMASEIDWWNSGNWQVYVSRIYSTDNQKQYGQDSQIVNTRGYMIKANQEVEIKP